MALSEFELKKCEKAVKAFLKVHRPPPHIRKELDFGFRIQNQSIELFEIRPEWKNPENTMELPFAKSTYVRTQGIWKVYWRRQDLKWHRYDPAPEAKSVEEFLEIVARDDYGCFFG